MTNSNSKRSSRKRPKHFTPPKPYPDFPLTPHSGGTWMKKIRGKLFYFGRWGRIVDGKMERLPDDGWREALDLYKAQADDLHAGRSPRIGRENELTVAGLCNAFLTVMQQRMQAGRKMSPRMFVDYRSTAERMSKALGKTTLISDLRPADFTAFHSDLDAQFGLVHLANEIQMVKTIFRYAVANELIPKLPTYGSEFKRPDQAEMRKHRAQRAKKLFTAGEIRQLLDAAPVQMKAMVLLGVNCAFGNTDVAELPTSAVDLEKGWVDFPRPKNGIERRCSLWPETVQALRAALAERPKPTAKADAACVFITVHGNRWVRVNVKTEVDDKTGDTIVKSATQVNAVALEFGKLMRRLGINGRAGLGFYSLRHTFRTVADATLDVAAIRLIMGHGDSSIDSVYREHIGDARLQAVTAHVRAWLMGGAT